MESSICRFHRCSPTVTAMPISSGRPVAPTQQGYIAQAVDHQHGKDRTGQQLSKTVNILGSRFAGIENAKGKNE